VLYYWLLHVSPFQYVEDAIDVGESYWYHWFGVSRKSDCCRALVIWQAIRCGQVYQIASNMSSAIMCGLRSHGGRMRIVHYRTRQWRIRVDRAKGI